MATGPSSLSFEDLIDAGDGEVDTLFYNSVTHAPLLPGSTSADWESVRVDTGNSIADIIGLSAIDANVGMHGNQAFTSVSDPSGIPGGLWTDNDVEGVDRVIYGDVDGGGADLIILITAANGGFDGFIPTIVL
mgnify:CR=1 FL=1